MTFAEMWATCQTSDEVWANAVAVMSTEDLLQLRLLVELEHNKQKARLAYIDRILDIDISQAERDAG
jgi:7,8-dihydro-6-hydroxymethylpterin-pyrophosphokinase